MRKRYRVLLIAAVAAALVVPFGYALSVESQPQAPSSSVLARADLAKTAAAAVVVAPVLIRTGATSAATTAALPASNRAVPDAGKLLLVGTVLFGLSALVRKTI